MNLLAITWFIFEILNNLQSLKYLQKFCVHIPKMGFKKNLVISYNELYSSRCDLKNCASLTALWLKTKAILNNSSTSAVVNILPLRRITNQRLSEAEIESVGQKVQSAFNRGKCRSGENFSTARVTYSIAYTEDDLMKWVKLQRVQFNF